MFVWIALSKHKKSKTMTPSDSKTLVNDVEEIIASGRGLYPLRVRVFQRWTDRWRWSYSEVNVSHRQSSTTLQLCISATSATSQNSHRHTILCRSSPFSTKSTSAWDASSWIGPLHTEYLRNVTYVH